MDELQACFVCEKDDTGDVVRCSGICNRWTHAKCVKLSKSVAKSIEESDNVMYMCDDCNSNSLSAVNSKLNKMLSFMCICEERVNRSEKNVSNLIDQMSEIKMLLCDSKNKSETVNKIPTTKKAKTFAEKVKMSKNESVLLLKPKKNQNSSDTENDLKKVIDPTKVCINNLRRFPKGGIAIECDNINGTREVQKLVNEKMSEQYVITVPELRRPRVKIVGIEEEMNEEELGEALKSQNEFLAKSEMKVINLFATKRNNFTAIIEMDANSFEASMKARRVKIKWSSCFLCEDLNVYRCYNCNGYNHKRTNCTNKKSCQRCASDHDAKECNSTIEVCVNCKEANEKFNLRLSTNHSANSEKCTVYMRKVEAERRKIKYSM